ncbi:cysteate racemase [Cellulosimicrobium cellulans]|uniref:aspartate/glutamate racemase family protein n=1 Tax=Cellulosimicrobium cellulans TaxID=1710 RepID=UPI001883AB52|nr:amino acid racemase [Cellulosimicrobium cellulans]MBE9940311.1 amino acid racemase [Cellulosimicrobium cellulans]
MTSRPDQDHAQPLVGVLGGVGPLATAYFLQLLVALTEAERDQDHVDAVVLNHATIPDRTDFILGRSDADPGPVLARDAERLERFGADFLVMPCNTAHYFTQQVLDAISVPFVSIIDTTVDAARARVDGLRAVGLLATAGTAASGVYQDAFARHGVQALVPDDADQALVSQIIYEQVKAGRPVDIETFRAVAGRLVERGAQVIVLGCTELSVVAVDHDLLADPLYLDSTDQLARATIRRAGHRVRGA